MSTTVERTQDIEYIPTFHDSITDRAGNVIFCVDKKMSASDILNAAIDAKVKLDYAYFDRWHFDDHIGPENGSVVMFKAHFYNCHFRDIAIQGIQFISSKLNCCNMYNVEFVDTSLQRCVANLTNINMSNFSKCDLSRFFFFDGLLKKTTFDRCNMHRTVIFTEKDYDNVYSGSYIFSAMFTKLPNSLLGSHDILPVDDSDEPRIRVPEGAVKVWHNRIERNEWKQMFSF